LDESITWVGVALIVIGAAGVFIAYSGVSKTFESGLQAVAVLLLLLGIIILPGGIARGGLPSLTLGQAAILGAVVAISVAGLTAAAIVGYGPFELLHPAPEAPAESPIKVYVSIIPGSWNPNQPDNYVPKNIMVLTGVNNTVIWTNDEELDITHTVTSDEGIWDSGLFGKGEKFIYTFNQEGVFSYHCIPHPWMKGSVSVKAVSQDEATRILEQLGISIGEKGE